MTNQNYQNTLEVLHECMEACNHCFDACLKEDDVKMMAGCIRLDRECADMCGYLEAAITRGSAYISDLAAVCAKICDDCAEECAKHDHDHCQKCAEACRKCADACREIA